jgi:nickel-dependent lactate racemase
LITVAPLHCAQSMRLEIPYGKDGHQPLHVPDERLQQVVRPNDVRAEDDLQAIRDGLDQVIAPSLEDFFKGEVLIIVNDGTRPTPTSRVLQVLEERVDLDQAKFLIATGAHRAPTEDELERIFGGRLHRLRTNIRIHDARHSKTELLGTSRNGTDIWVNELVAKHERIMVITSVEPHYFAGFTGGRKSILPGVCAYSTIEQNHKLAMRPEAKLLALEGNPVHEDMMDCLQHLAGKKLFGVQVVLDRHQKVYSVAAGELHASFKKAVEHANQVFVVPIKRRAGIVVSIVSFPMDVDLYQSQKAIENAKGALEEGGTLIFVSKCRQGIGEQRFYDVLSSSADKDQMLRGIEAEYRLGDHKASKILEIAKRSRICGVTSLDPESLQRIDITPFESAQAALDDALARDPKASVIVIYDGSVVVPKVS